MNESTPRRRLRWLYLAAALIVLVPLLLWAAAAPLLALVVQLELRRAGWTEAQVAGASVGLSGIVIDQVSLTPADTFVAEGVRPRLGRSGVESIAISRLRLEAELTPDGALVLPGAHSPEDLALPLHVLPPEGMQLDRAAVRLVTPAGDANLSMTDASVRSGPDGVELFGRYRLAHDLIRLEGAAAVGLGHDDFVRARLTVDGGQIALGGFLADVSGGEVLAQRPPAGAPSVALVLRTQVARPTGGAAGAFGLEADWRGGVLAFALRSADARVLDVTLEGRADLRDDKPTISLAGQVLLKETPLRGQLSFDGDFAGAGPEAASGRLDVTVRDLAFPTAYGDGRIDQLTAGWTGTVIGTADRLAIFASDCVAWDIGSVRLGDIALSKIAPPCLAPKAGDAILTYDAGDGRVRLAASTAAQPFAESVVDGGRETTISGTWPASRVTAAVSAAGLESLALELSAGEVTLPGEQVSLRAVAGSAEFAGGARVSVAGVLESLSTPALWVPLDLEVGATGRGGRISFDAALSDRLGTLVIEAAGHYQDGAATSRLRLHPVRFFAGAAQPGDLFPVLRDYVQNASGVVEFTGELSRSKANVQSTGTLSIPRFDATIAGVEIGGAETSMAFRSLLPPVTAPHQRMTIDKALVGMPLEQGVLVYDLDAHGRLTVRHLEFHVAGGRLYSEPFIIDSGGVGDIGMVLRAEEIDLSQLLAGSRIEGLEGTGMVSGRIPVRISARGLELDPGVLTAETNGVLRYVPRELPAFLQGDDLRASMLREVLTNFHYEELSVQVMGESGDAEAQRVTLAARGSNPDFLEGHPIELNVNFEGALLGAARSAAEVSGAAEIQELSEQEGRGNEESTP